MRPPYAKHEFVRKRQKPQLPLRVLVMQMRQVTGAPPGVVVNQIVVDFGQFVQRDSLIAPLMEPFEQIISKLISPSTKELALQILLAPHILDRDH